MKGVLEEVLMERQRQKNAAGWTESVDRKQDQGELCRAAACYAAHASAFARVSNIGVTADEYREFAPVSIAWPWERRWWKPKNPREDMIRAAALLVAEVERLDMIEAEGAVRKSVGVPGRRAAEFQAHVEAAIKVTSPSIA